MAQRSGNASLLVGIVMSVVLHAVIILPAMIAALSAERTTFAMPARFDPEDFVRSPEIEEEPPPPDETVLGIDAPTPSTLTWIGYEEYQEHLAQIAEVEQAAFETKPAGAPLPPTDPVGIPDAEPLENPTDSQEPPSDPVPPTELTPTEPAAPAETTEVAEATAEPPPVSPVPETNLAESEIPFPFEALAELARRADEAPATEKEQEPDPALVKKTEEAKKPATAAAQPETPPATKGQDQTDPAKAADASPNPPADVADKESEATSTIDVDFKKLGKPIARPGLEIRPRRPHFTTLLTVTAAPGNPIVEIDFDRRGRPADARILRSSGDSRIDGAIESSLFRWRASGKRLRTLKGKETLTIRLQILLRGAR